MMFRRGSFVVFAALLATTGCVVGPNFNLRLRRLRSQATRLSHRKRRQRRQRSQAGKRSNLSRRGDIPADWWTLFHSRTRTTLIEQALANNPDLKAAQAALLVAHENTRAQRGAYCPQVSAGAGVTREKDPSGDARPGPSNNAFLYTLDHAAAQRFLRARRLRPEQADRRGSRRRSRQPATR